MIYTILSLNKEVALKGLFHEIMLVYFILYF